MKEPAGSKVLNHPDKEEIVKKLLNGESVKEVAAWLKRKHSKKKRLHVSYMTLQTFRKDHLHLDGEVLEDIKEARRVQLSEAKDIEIKEKLSSSSAYQDKLNQIVSDKLDSNRKLLEMISLVSSRMEVYFNALQNSPNLKADKMFIELLNTQRGLVQDWKRYVEGAADKRIEHNVNINVINEQVTVLKNIVFEVLQELEPALVPLFIEKINSRLSQIQYGSPQYDAYQLEMAEIIDAE